MRAITVCMLVLSAHAARADQCAIVAPEIASAAVRIINGSPIASYCQPCGEPRPTVASASTAHRVVARDGKVMIDGKAVDLAYIYVLTGPHAYTNVGLMTGCGARDVDGFLDLSPRPMSVAERELVQVDAELARTAKELRHASSEAARRRAQDNLASLSARKRVIEEQLARVRMLAPE